jgi:hypothetical protein
MGKWFDSIGRRGFFKQHFLKQKKLFNHSNLFFMSYKTLSCFNVQPQKNFHFPDLDSNYGPGSAAGHTLPAETVAGGERQ